MKTVQEQEVDNDSTVSSSELPETFGEWLKCNSERYE